MCASMTRESMTLQAVEKLDVAGDSVAGASDHASGVLNAMGMSGAASTVQRTSTQVQQGFGQSADTARQVDARNWQLQMISDLIYVLRDEFAPPLSRVGGMVTDLNGRNMRYWKGDGATAYKDHTDIQEKAASELSANAVKLAKIIQDGLDSSHTFDTAMTCAILGGIGAIIGGIPALTPPATAIGVALICGGLTALITGACEITKAQDEHWKDKHAILDALASLETNDGSTSFDDTGDNLVSSVFRSGHWPSRELY